MMNAPRRSSRLRQQGMVTVLAVIFLISAVIFALSQTLGITGANSIDSNQQLDGTAALYLAESGLERAMGVLASAAAGGTLTNSVCSGISSTSPPETLGYPLGRGHFKYVSATPSPDPCTGVTCNGCSVTVTGTVDTGTANSVSASRTLSLDIKLRTVNGVSGFGTNVTMPMKNTSSVAATAMFNLAWRRQGGTGPAGEVPTGGNASATNCGGPGCGLQWNDESSSGNPSAGSMGISFEGILPGGVHTVIQTIDTGRNYAEVGLMMPGFSTTISPPIKGAYWKDVSGGSGTKTVNNSNATPSTGETNSGVVAAVSGTCTTPSATSTGTQQTCNSWCYGADTLVFGVSARSASTADQISGVTFNTNGSPAQNIALTQVAHFPISTTINATGDIYSEIWYAYNPDYLSLVGAYSGWATTGSIGVSSFDASVTSGSPTMNVTSLSGFLHVGDTVSCTTGGACGFSPTTIATNGTPCGAGAVTCAANGNYTLASNSTVTRTRSFKTSSSFLDVSAVPSPVPSIGDTITGGTVAAGTTITSVPGGLVYGISSAQLVSSTTITANTATISVPGGTTIPTASTMILAVRGGTGAFQANTTVLSSPAPAADSFRVSAVPTTRLSAATICGGTCAFFNDPSSTSSTTQFTVTRTAGTDQWAGGFTCLSGVDPTKITPISNSLITGGTWREAVQ